MDTNEILNNYLNRDDVFLKKMGKISHLFLQIYTTLSAIESNKVKIYLKKDKTPIKILDAIFEENFKIKQEIESSFFDYTKGIGITKKVICFIKFLLENYINYHEKENDNLLIDDMPYLINSARKNVYLTILEEIEKQIINK